MWPNVVITFSIDIPSCIVKCCVHENVYKYINFLTLVVKFCRKAHEGTKTKHTSESHGKETFQLLLFGYAIFFTNLKLSLNILTNTELHTAVIHVNSIL